MLLYFLGAIFLLIVLFFIFIRIKYRFWAVQPVYHFYDVYYWFFNIGIIRHELPEKNRYTNFKDIETITSEKVLGDDSIMKAKLTSFMDLIQLNYLKNDDNTFLPEKENIIPYFEGHNSPSFFSFFWEPDVLIDVKTNTTIDTKMLVGAITSRPLTVTIYKTNNPEPVKFDIFYVDYLCVKKGFRKKNIAPQLIQTHEYNQCHINKNICVSLFKREGELTGIIPLTVYQTYVFDMKNWVKPPEQLHSKTTLLVGDSQNMYYLYNFINELTNSKKQGTNCKWDITIIPEMTNLISLVKSKNIYIYMLLTDMEIEAVYIFKKTCTNIEKGKGLLSLIASINSINLSLTKFIQGFKNVLWEILLNNPNYHYLAIENVSDNKYIIDNIKVKTHPTFESPTAYFFYNYARSPFDSNRALIIN
jgi:hypothetical protein